MLNDIHCAPTTPRPTPFFHNKNYILLMMRKYIYFVLIIYISFYDQINLNQIGVFILNFGRIPKFIIFKVYSKGTER